MRLWKNVASVNPPVLVLASASPRRAELLTAAGIPFEVRPAHVDERPRTGETAAVYVQRVAEEKARAVAGRLPGRAVLAADTSVVIDDQILGKPADARDAARMLRLLSGRRHQVLTGVCLITEGPPGSAVVVDTRIAATLVWFAPLDEAEIAWYVSSGEPMDKAGAYAVQGLAGRFIERLEGSYPNVVGLPVALVYQMCTAGRILLS